MKKRAGSPCKPSTRLHPDVVHDLVQAGNRLVCVRCGYAGPIEEENP